MKLVPTINANIFSTSAFIIGLLLTDDFSPAEQNALGGWFMLIGQTLCTNSGQQQLLNNRSNASNLSNQHVINSDVSGRGASSGYTSSTGYNQNSQNDIEYQIAMINKVIRAMQAEIDNLKNT